MTARRSDRRSFLKLTAATGALATLGSLLAACQATPAASPTAKPGGASQPGPAPGTAQAPATGAAPAGVTTIRLAHGQPPADLTPVIFLPEVRTAIPLDHFDKSYTVQPTLILGTNLHATALAADEQDLVLLDFMTLPQSIEKGVLRDIKIIDDVKLDGHPDYRGNVFRVMADSGISTPADLRGKTVTTVTIGQSIDFAFRIWAKQGGLDPDRDVQIVEMPFTAVGAALREGRVAMGPFIPPFDALEADRGGMRDVFTLRDVFGPNEQLFHVAETSWLQANSQAVKDFLADSLKGRKWALDERNRDQVISIMSETYKVPKETYELFFGTSKDDFRHPDGCVSAKYLNEPAEKVRQEGAYQERIDLAQYIDHSYLPNPAACQGYA